MTTFQNNLKADAAAQYSLLDVDQFVVDEAIDLTSRHRHREPQRAFLTMFVVLRSTQRVDSSKH